jgi:anion transporter
MQDSSIALIIAIVAFILLATEKIPLYVTAILATCAMHVAGFLTLQEAFSGFTSSITLLLIGIWIVGEAGFTTGLAEIIGRWTIKLAGNSEKRLGITLYVIASLMSAIFPMSVCVMTFLPIVDSTCMNSKGTMRRKQLYFPLITGAALGGNLTLIGATNMLLASNQFAVVEGGRNLTFFEPLSSVILAWLAVGLFYWLVGYDLQEKWFDFPDTDIEERVASPGAGKDAPAPWKRYMAGGVLIACIVLFIWRPVDIAITALVGACILIIAGCIDAGTAVKSVSWSTILLVVGLMGLGKGLEVTGAGKVFADAVLRICGPLGNSSFAMCAVMLLLSTLLSNFMSDNAAVIIVLPVALGIAKSLGTNVVPFVLACGIGSTIAMATPICKSTFTAAMVAGYRLKDYVRAGGLYNLISFVSVCLSLYVIYFI